MSITLSLVVKGVDLKAIERRAKNPRTISLPMWDAARQIGAVVQRGMSEEAPRGADSLLAISMDFQVLGAIMPEIIRIGPGVEYGVFVAEGTRPHFPPYRAGSGLERWVRLKLGVQAPESVNVAFLIARRIAATGTLPNEYHRRGLNRVFGEIITIWSEMQKLIVHRVLRGGI